MIVYLYYILSILNWSQIIRTLIPIVREKFEEFCRERIEI